MHWIKKFKVIGIIILLLIVAVLLSKGVLFQKKITEKLSKYGFDLQLSHFQMPFYSNHFEAKGSVANEGIHADLGTMEGVFCFTSLLSGPKKCSSLMVTNGSLLLDPIAFRNVLERMSSGLKHKDPVFRVDEILIQSSTVAIQRDSFPKIDIAFLVKDLRCEQFLVSDTVHFRNLVSTLEVEKILIELKAKDHQEIEIKTQEIAFEQLKQHEFKVPLMTSALALFKQGRFAVESTVSVDSQKDVMHYAGKILIKEMLLKPTSELSFTESLFYLTVNRQFKGKEPWSGEFQFQREIPIHDRDLFLHENLEKIKSLQIDTLLDIFLGKNK